MEVVYINPYELVEHPRNRNRHPLEQIERLARIIEYSGFRVPIIVSKNTGFIVSGHGRKDASLLLKMESVPVIYQDFASEADEYRMLIADNEIAKWSELDKHGVISDFKDFEMQDLKLPDLELFGLVQEDFFKKAIEMDFSEDEKNKEINEDEIKQKSKQMECPNCGERIML
jgi:hypothetical protein